MPTLAFATFLIVCPTAFFLGILFSLFPYDYPLLWASGSPTEAHLLQTEAHLRLLHASPALIVRILHTMIFLGLAGLITKLYKPSESNMLFDGGSLVLYVCAIIVYGANIIKGLRIVTLGTYGAGAENADADAVEDGRESVLGREDNLKVLSASNTILALVLVGVLILQAGQWYAERADEKEKVKMHEQEERERREERGESEDSFGGSAATTTATGTGTAGRRDGKRDGKKSK